MSGESNYGNKEWLRDGKILLYTRNNRPIYHCRLKIDGIPNYIIKSTKKKNLAEASRFAEELFDDLRYKQRHGMEIDHFLFKKVWKQWFDTHKVGLSDNRQRYHQGTANRYFIPFFGEKEVSTLKDSDFEDYWQWRIHYWDSEEGTARISKAQKQRPTKQNPHKSKLGNVAKVPSQVTLRMEQGALRQIMRWANNRGITNRIPTIKAPKLQNQKQVSRRPALELKEWAQINNYLDSWVDECREVQPRVNGSFAKSDTKIKRPHALHLQQRKLVRDYLRFMIASGLRPNEARQLRWCDVTDYFDDEGNEQIELEIAASTKTGQRPVTPMKNAIDALESIKSYSTHTNDKDLIFCDRNGNPATDFNKTFRKILENIGLLEDKDGNRRVIYSLRHTYASWMLLYGDINVYELSKNMGCGVKQIENHYGHLTSRDVGHKFGSLHDGEKFKRAKINADFEEFLRLTEENPEEGRKSVERGRELLKRSLEVTRRMNEEETQAED